MAKRRNKETFKFSLCIKGCDKVLAEGMDPGEIVSQEVTFTVEPDELVTPMFIKALMDMESEMIKDNIEVKVAKI